MELPTSQVSLELCFVPILVLMVPVVLGQIPWTRALLAFLPVPSPILTYQQVCCMQLMLLRQ